MSKNVLTPETIAVTDEVIGAITLMDETSPAVIMAGLTSALFLVGKQMGLTPDHVVLGVGMCAATADKAFSELNEAGVSF